MRQQQVLDANELVLHAPGLILGRAQHLVQSLREVALARGAGDAGQLLEIAAQLRLQLPRVRAQTLHHLGHHALALLQQRVEQVLYVYFAVVVVFRQALSAGDGLLGLLGKTVGVHICMSASFRWRLVSRASRRARRGWMIQPLQAAAE